MSEQDTEEIYRDEYYCCMDCGCEHFVVKPGPKDRCNNCGSLRNNKRGPTDARR